MKHLDELKKQVKQPQGKGQTGKTADKMSALVTPTSTASPLSAII